MKQNKMKIALVTPLLVAIAAFFYFDLGQYLSFQFLKLQQAAFQEYYLQNKALTISAFFGVYVALTALSLPGAAILTLAAGGLFGLVTGTIIVSFASSLGATLAFLVSRFLLRDWVQNQFGEKLKKINEGVQEEGAFYLLSLRLIPVFPFFVINLVMGLTPIKVITFYFISQIGMLAGTIVYVNAGTQLGQLDSLKGILSPPLILSFVLLGLFPLVTKKIMTLIKKKRVTNAKI